MSILETIFKFSIENMRIYMSILSNLFSNNIINNHFYGGVEVQKISELNQAQMNILTGLDTESQQRPITETQGSQSEDCDKEHQSLTKGD